MQLMEATVDEVIKPHKSKVEVMTTRIMGGGGYSLNKNLETLLKTPSNDGRFGLGSEAQEASFEGNTVYACPPDFELNNWDSVDLPTFSRDFQDSTLDALIYTMESDKESDDEDDVGISSEFLRMVEEEDEVLGPHQELVEAINLGSQEE
ncbi:uncharacterized protein E5676_scaffold21G003750 [Cucumis melo var. makuwa]|uniref:Uncharacterized protein n=1 Tax=Cucumis melo var. makuwa TaxID=1194695 RepID=A0A5D3D1J4_CUCMM|nr:uncharacterized protein E6C27_scaffold74G002090 [Cucumis melo var. makuwa]TYK16556.1 uncharacterized protein E5676_scaffold21G003750 [Cucumis melo var. makuwa]